MKAEAEIALDDYLAHAPNEHTQPARWRWHVERYRFAVRQMTARRAGAGIGRVADIGCGIGLGLGELSPVADQVLAADINPELIDHLRTQREHDNVTYTPLDIHDGPPPGGPYDLICAFEVIEHLEQPGIAVEHLKAALRPGGVLVLSTPHSPDGGLGSHDHHACAFEHETLAALLSESFPHIESYSQGSRQTKAEMLRRKDQSPWVRLLRAVDVLEFRRWLPTTLRDRALETVTGIDPEDSRDQLYDIAPGMDPEARWSVVLCAFEAGTADER